jgi:cell division septation protein DedD
VNEKTAGPAETNQLKAQKTASPETAVKDSIYTIQVAAVKDMNSAEKLMSDLVNKGYQAYISSGEVPGKGTWHRVRIGGFRERGEAENILSGLGKYKSKGIIVKK